MSDERDERREEALQLIENFVFSHNEYIHVPERIKRLARRIAYQADDDTLICRSQTFGFFIITRSLSTLWVESNDSKRGAFLDILKKDAREGCVVSHKTVARQQSTSAGEVVIYPRIYVDGANIVDCDMEIDEPITIVFDKNRNMIRISRRWED